MCKTREPFSLPPKGKQRFGATPPRPLPRASSSLSTVLLKRETFAFQSKCWWFGVFLSQFESRGICCEASQGFASWPAACAQVDGCLRALGRSRQGVFACRLPNQPGGLGISDAVCQGLRAPFLARFPPRHRRAAAAARTHAKLIRGVALRQNRPARSSGSSAGEKLRGADSRNPADKKDLHSSDPAGLPSREGCSGFTAAIRQQERRDGESRWSDSKPLQTQP